MKDSYLTFFGLREAPFSKEIPDIRNFVNEATRLATYAGEGQRVTSAIVNQQIAEVEQILEDK